MLRMGSNPDRSMKTLEDRYLRLSQVYSCHSCSLRPPVCSLTIVSRRVRRCRIVSKMLRYLRAPESALRCALISAKNSFGGESEPEN